MLTRGAILGKQDAKIEEVHVPEWVDENGDDLVYVRGMTGAERDAFEAETYLKRTEDGQQNYVNFRARLCIRAICDETGKRIFSDNDVDFLGAKQASALDRVFAAAQRLAGIGRKDVEEMTKNSQAGQSVNSTSV